MNEYRVTVTIAEHGASEDSAETVLDAFTSLHGAAGAVVSQHLADLTLSVTFSFEATDPWAAANVAAEMFASGMAASELRVIPILDVCVTAVEYEPEPHIHRGEAVLV